MNEWSVYDEIEYQDKKKEFYLCLFLGWAGIHRFYKKKIGTGILYLCTLGCLFIGWAIDLIKVAIQWDKLSDKKKRIESLNSAMEKIHRTRGMTIEESKRELSRKYCPSCKSGNCHAFVEEVVLREGKVKGKITPNLNPLKPFTIANYKEKEVRKPITTQVSKFVCNDCGKIFT